MDSFDKFLENVRARPKRQRQMIAAGISLLVTLFVAAVWHLNFHSGTNAPAPTDDIAASSTSPFGEVDKSASQALSELSRRWNDVVSTASPGSGTEEATTSTSTEEAN